MNIYLQHVVLSTSSENIIRVTFLRVVLSIIYILVIMEFKGSKYIMHIADHKM